MLYLSFFRAGSKDTELIADRQGADPVCIRLQHLGNLR